MVDVIERKYIMKKILAFISVMLLAIVLSACNSGGSDEVFEETEIEQSISTAQLQTEKSVTSLNTTAVSSEVTTETISTTTTTPATIAETTTSATTAATTTTTATTTPETTTQASTSQEVVLIPMSELSEEDEKKLRDDFAEYTSGRWDGVITGDDMVVLKYYGTYNGCEAVVMYASDYPVTEDMQEIAVGDYVIHLSSGSLELLLHQNSTFVDIRDAYEQGLIDENDVYSIKYYANWWEFE